MIHLEKRRRRHTYLSGYRNYRLTTADHMRISLISGLRGMTLTNLADIPVSHSFLCRIFIFFKAYIVLSRGKRKDRFLFFILISSIRYFSTSIR